MRVNRFPSVVSLILFFMVAPCFFPAFAQTLKEQNEILLEQIQKVHGASDKQMDAIRTIFRESGYIGQGNPAVTRHPSAPGT